MSIKIDRTFRCNYDVTVDYDVVRTYPMVREDERLSLAVQLSTSLEKWTAVFRVEGNSDARKVMSCPSPNELAVLCGERLYILDVSRGATYAEKSFSPVRHVALMANKGLLVMAGYTSMTAYGAGRTIWELNDLCWDELSITNVDDHRGVICASGFNAPLNAMKDFAIDAQTGAVLQ